MVSIRSIRNVHQRTRRGVASVLAMMFLVIFGSLGVAMAIVAQGNLRTADSSIKVSRAMSAAETGLVFASKRLAKEAQRFVIDKGVVDGTFGHKLWLANWDAGSDGDVQILPPTGFTESSPADGLGKAVVNAHAADEGTLNVEPGDSALPAMDADGTIEARAMKVIAADTRVWFRLKYELVENQPVVRVTSVGADGDIRRTLQMDFKINKRIEYAVISPNRLMIGKNVLIDGPLGTRYGTNAGELNAGNGNPLVMRSDFYYLADELDTKLDTLYAAVKEFDTDGDARLRPANATEAQGISGNSELIDVDGNEYVDDFDLFLGRYDSNADKRVVYDENKALAAGQGSLSGEFVDVDDQLARLIDQWQPDRNSDGAVDGRDTQLGYNDGVLDQHDHYAKQHGRLAFGVTKSEWEIAKGDSYQTVVQGPISCDIDDAPVSFGVPDDVLRLVTTSMFASSATWFAAQASNGTAFAAQVTSGLGSGGTYTAPSAATWEPVPFGSPAAYDWYQRPVYANMTFTNVKIPKGTNALFVNCTFVGVTYVAIESGCTDVNWNYAGSLKKTTLGGGSVVYSPKFPGLTATLGGVPVTDTKVHSNSIRFDGCTFLGSVSADTPGEFTHWRNKVQMSGNTRFYLDPNDPDLAAQTDGAQLKTLLNTLSAADREMMARSQLMMPGWSIDVGNFANDQAADPEDTPKVNLRGTIIAGVLDVRGTADVFGTLLMTFRPVNGQGPLFYDGQADMFNTTIGYFGSLDGDGEGAMPGDTTFQGFGEITLRYNSNALLPDGIPWPISMEAQPHTYVEGGPIS
ncbi:MAG: hypothetical protein SGJ09_08655 [Phycisphaerae bacterium]|nr:hypothetical protein [Phycisphaerae bacterium]